MCVVGKNREPLFVKTVIEGQSLLEEFSYLLVESEASMQLNEKRAWWGTRRKLDRRMKACTQHDAPYIIMTSFFMTSFFMQEIVDCMQSKWLGDYTDILVPSPPSPEATSCHLLCVGRKLQHLPWEAMPVLQGQAVARTPSLTFSIAHHILQRK